MSPTAWSWPRRWRAGRRSAAFARGALPELLRRGLRAAGRARRRRGAGGGDRPARRELSRDAARRHAVRVLLAGARWSTATATLYDALAAAPVA